MTWCSIKCRDTFTFTGVFRLIWRKAACDIRVSDRGVDDPSLLGCDAVSTDFLNGKVELFCSSYYGTLLTNSYATILIDSDRMPGVEACISQRMDRMKRNWGDIHEFMENWMTLHQAFKMVVAVHWTHLNTRVHVVRRRIPFSVVAISSRMLSFKASIVRG